MDKNIKRKFNKRDNVVFNPSCFKMNKKENSNFKEGKIFEVVDVHYNYCDNELMYEINWSGSYLYKEELIKIEL